MNKQAYFKLRGLRKTATTPSEQVLANYVGSAIFPVTGLGQLVGRVSDDSSSTKEYDKDKLGYIPGLSGYRLARRRSQSAKLLGAKNNQAISEILGPLTSTVVAAGVGAGLGGALGGARDAAAGAGAGMLTAAGMTAVSALAALIARKRTAAQQKQYEDQGGFTNYLIPGRAVYGNYKTTGFLMGDEYKKLREVSYKENKKPQKEQKDDNLQLAIKAKQEADKDPFGGIKVIRKG